MTQIFPLYPENGCPLFYACEIYDTEAEMHARVRELRGKTIASDKEIAAVCLRFVHEQFDDSTKRFRVSPIIGRILLHRGYMADDVVVHELTHAVIGWARRKRINLNSTRSEERIASATQKLFADFRENLSRVNQPKAA